LPICIATLEFVMRLSNWSPAAPFVSRRVDHHCDGCPSSITMTWSSGPLSRSSWPYLRGRPDL